MWNICFAWRMERELECTPLPLKWVPPWAIWLSPPSLRCGSFTSWLLSKFRWILWWTTQLLLQDWHPTKYLGRDMTTGEIITNPPYCKKKPHCTDLFWFDFVGGTGALGTFFPEKGPLFGMPSRLEAWCPGEKVTENAKCYSKGLFQFFLSGHRRRRGLVRGYLVPLLKLLAALFVVSLGMFAVYLLCLALIWVWSMMTLKAAGIIGLVFLGCCLQLFRPWKFSTQSSRFARHPKAKNKTMTNPLIVIGSSPIVTRIALGLCTLSNTYYQMSNKYIYIITGHEFFLTKSYR